MSRCTGTRRWIAAFLMAAGILAGSLAGAQDLGRSVQPSGEDPDALVKRLGSSSDDVMNFSFDQVDVRAFVKLVGEATGRRFVVADDVAGRITVAAPSVKRSDVYPLFVSILESVGCSVVEEKDLHRIVKLGKRDVPAAPVVGVGEQTPAKGIVTKVFLIQNVSATEIKKLLQSKVGGGRTGAIESLEETGHLIITDTAENVRRLAKIVEEIDRPGAARVTEIVALQYASAKDIADQLNAALAEGKTRGQMLRNRLPIVSTVSERRPPVVVAASQANAVILVGTPSQIDDIKEMIRAMDVDIASSRGRLNAVFLKYISADEAAKSISGLLEKSYGKEGARKGRSIAIEASPANNALLIDASPGDFEVVKKLVEQIDQEPEQVHIEVLIAEVSSDDSLSLGVEMTGLELGPGPGGGTLMGSSTLSDQTEGLMSVIERGLIPRGLSVGVLNATLNADGTTSRSFGAGVNLDALKKRGDFTILSETSLEAQNNREASISIVNEIPVLKSTIEGGTGSARDIIQNIERIEVGTQLKLTPHVIDGREVRMVLNPSIEAVVDSGPSGTLFAPTIARREVSTTVTVPDGRTIVIAGLTREDSRSEVRKFPVLGSIPIIGLLFRQTVEQTEKRNMLIFVTPHIVSGIARAEQVMKLWEEKTGLSPHEDD
ncbi:MAG: type II secretion system secretin GspD [Lentisphaerae bacterium]|nr:type II secretion system secretin GspD [Lentisphaerota bacterium]